MNNFLFSKMTDNTIPVRCTKHAIERAVQRCKLLMHRYERDNPSLFLIIGIFLAFIIPDDPEIECTEYHDY